MGGPLTAMAVNFHLDPSKVANESQCAQYGAVWDSENSWCLFDQDACTSAGGGWTYSGGKYYCNTAALCSLHDMSAGTPRFDTSTKKCVLDGAMNFFDINGVNSFVGVGFRPVNGFVFSQQNCWDYDADGYAGGSIGGTSSYSGDVLSYGLISYCDANQYESGHIDPAIAGQGQCAQYGAVWDETNHWCKFAKDACTSVGGKWWPSNDDNNTANVAFCMTSASCVKSQNDTNPYTYRWDSTAKECYTDDAVRDHSSGTFVADPGYDYSDGTCEAYTKGTGTPAVKFPSSGAINFSGPIVSSYCDVTNLNIGGGSGSGGTIGEAHVDPSETSQSSDCAQYGAVWDETNQWCKFTEAACTSAGGRWWTLSGYGVCMTQASCIREDYRWDSTNKLCVVDGSIKDHGTGTFETVNGFTYSSENCAAYTPGTGTTNQDIQSGAVVTVSDGNAVVLTYCEVDDGSGSAHSPFRVSRLTPTEADGTLIASGAYAKGAYNANVGNINTALTYVEDSSVETIKHATVSAENVSLSVAGLTPAGTIDVDSSNATVSGTVNVANTVTMFSEWGTTSTENGTLSGSQQVSIANGAVTGMTGTFSGPASGQLSGTGSLSNASVHVNNWVPVNPS